MYRAILTGIFVCVLSAGSGAIAAADEITPTTSAAVTTDPATNARPATAAISAADIESIGAAMSTASAPGAVFVPLATAEAASEPVKHINRLRRFASGIVSRSSAIASSLTRSAMRFIGTPYVFGGTRSTGFDCSGYVQHVYAMLGMHLPRTADAQFDAGHHILAAMHPGDLVFFHTYARGVSHVGIYLGNNKFIHSSSSRGVAISTLHDRYWAPRYLGAKRVFGS